MHQGNGVVEASGLVGQLLDVHGHFDALGDTASQDASFGGSSKAGGVFQFAANLA